MQIILIVSGDKAFVGRFAAILADIYPAAEVSSALCCADAKGAVQGGCDLVIIDGTLSETAAGELMADITEKTDSGCIVIAPDGQEETLADKLEDMGILVLPQQADTKLVRCTVKLISASRKRIRGYAKENLRLHRRLDEIKAVNRAKLVLMQYLKFSESQAHKYIEKQAMDLRMTRYEIAMKIIKTYDLDA